MTLTGDHFEESPPCVLLLPDSISLHMCAASTEVLATASQAKAAAAGAVGRGNAAKLELVDHLRWLSGFDASGAVIVRSNRMAVRTEQQRVLRLKFLQVAEQALAAGGLFKEYLHGQLGLGLQQHLARHLASAGERPGWTCP